MIVFSNTLPKNLSFEDWLSFEFRPGLSVESQIDNYISESGLDLELDFDPESFIDDLYDTYLLLGCL